MIHIVGSGPAGVACARALVKKGFRVRMLDAGLELEPQRLRIIEKLRRTPAEDWDTVSLDSIKGNTSPDIRGIPRKYIYGSDFPYREVDRYIPIEAKQAEASPSLARGGFSNVWGAGVLPYMDKDIADWPISVADLAPHYQGVLSFLDLSAVKDDLESIQPLYSNILHRLRPSKQATAFIEDLKQSTDILKAEGFVFGYSRLAVRSQATHDSSGCTYCGLCMYGCPYGLIYNSSSTLAKLQESDHFDYVKDVVVEKLVESNGKVKIQARSRVNDEKLSLEASRVYLACGVLSTTKILLESLEAYDRPLVMKDSQYFTMPLLRYRKVPNVTAENAHTLCQIFIKLIDARLSENSIHFSIYSYNDLFLRLFKRLLGRAHSLFRVPINELLGRLLFIQGYLHSDISSTISIRLVRDKARYSGKLILEGSVNRVAEQVIKGIVGKIFSNRRYFQAIPIGVLAQVANPGRGFHSGGTFPMRNSHSNFESDCVGRPYGFRNVHVVDSTIFPSIPAGPITLSVMANAHRIASMS